MWVIELLANYLFERKTKLPADLNVFRRSQLQLIPTNFTTRLGDISTVKKIRYKILLKERHRKRVPVMYMISFPSSGG